MQRVPFRNESTVSSAKVPVLFEQRQVDGRGTLDRISLRQRNARGICPRICAWSRRTTTRVSTVWASAGSASAASPKTRVPRRWVVLGRMRGLHDAEARLAGSRLRTGLDAEGTAKTKDAGTDLVCGVHYMDGHVFLGLGRSASWLLDLGSRHRWRTRAGTILVD